MFDVTVHGRERRGFRRGLEPSEVEQPGELDLADGHHRKAGLADQRELAEERIRLHGGQAHRLGRRVAPARVPPPTSRLQWPWGRGRPSAGRWPDRQSRGPPRCDSTARDRLPAWPGGGFGPGNSAPRSRPCRRRPRNAPTGNPRAPVSPASIAAPCRNRSSPIRYAPAFSRAGVAGSRRSRRTVPGIFGPAGRRCPGPERGPQPAQGVAPAEARAGAEAARASVPLRD